MRIPLLLKRFSLPSTQQNRESEHFIEHKMKQRMARPYFIALLSLDAPRFYALFVERRSLPEISLLFRDSSSSSRCRPDGSFSDVDSDATVLFATFFLILLSARIFALWALWRDRAKECTQLLQAVCVVHGVSAATSVFLYTRNVAPNQDVLAEASVLVLELSLLWSVANPFIMWWIFFDRPFRSLQVKQWISPRRIEKPTTSPDLTPFPASIAAGNERKEDEEVPTLEDWEHE